MADISLVSRVRTTGGTTGNNSLKHGKNSNKTTKEGDTCIWRIFAELDKPERTLSKMNLTSMQVNMF